MAHKKGEGSTQNGRDSNAKRLGVKLYGGQSALAGNIILKQRGTKFHPGENVYMGKDYTLHAQVPGTVFFRKGYKGRTFVSIIPLATDETVATLPNSKPAPKANPEVVEIPVAVAVKPAPAPVSEETTTPEPAAPAVEEAAETAPAPAATTVVPAEEEDDDDWNIAADPADGKKDDLKKIEGIGPKIEGLLNVAGIHTFVKLSETAPEAIKEILEAAGSRYNIHDPGTWPNQARLAAEGKWDELKALQDELNGGK